MKNLIDKSVIIPKANKSRFEQIVPELKRRGQELIESDRFNKVKDETIKALENDSIKKGASLLWLNVSVRLKSLIEYLKTCRRYYLNLAFCKADLCLTGMYFFNSPFSISKRFLIQKGADEVYCYGETPPTTLDLISKECGITEQDHLFELGCGRGRGAFWFHAIKKCKVTAIEQIPEFVDRANMIKERLELKGIDFRNEDFLESDLNGATAIYLYGTALKDEDIKKLIENFDKLPPGTKVISVSYPLTDYSEKFELMKRFAADFPWGKTDVYLQLKK